MNKSLIVVTNKWTPITGSFGRKISNGIHGFKKFGDYGIIKVRPNRQYEKEHSLGTIFLPTMVQSSAEIVYDVKHEKFIKHRDGDITVPNRVMPSDLESVMGVVLEIVKNTDIDYLLENYNRQYVIEAIFLTDSYYERFQECVDVLEYQLARYKYGKEILPCYIPEMIKKYPEHLI